MTDPIDNCTRDEDDYREEWTCAQCLTSYDDNGDAEACCEDKEEEK